jgi:AcrR family transcriptional regulator
VSGSRSRADEGEGLPRLPPGRHGLSREFVVKNQRDRITAGMIQVVVERGYQAATVSQIVVAAGISRRTFYNYYPDKKTAFFDVYGQVTDFLCEAMAETGEGGRGWPGRVRAGLEGLLETYAANPDLVRFTLLAPPAAGGEVAAAYREFLGRLLEVIAEGRPKRTRKPGPAAEYGIVGGLAGLLGAAVEEGGSEALIALLPEAVELVLTPYLGREAAAQAAAG